MSIERLRALERYCLEQAEMMAPMIKSGAVDEGYGIGAGNAYKVCAQRIATLIAELGQEVGAVCDNCGKPLRNDAAPIHACACARLVMNPARTSEARDAARYRALKTHFQAKFHRATCDYWVIVGELKTDPRFIGEDGEQLTLDNALDAAIAAMRQEAE